MQRHSSPSFKENRPPPHSSCEAPYASRRRLQLQPLGKHKPSNIDAAAAARDADAWLKASHAALTLRKVGQQQQQQQSSAQSSCVAPPAAQPSASPDILRKKGSRDIGEGCFGLGPTVQGNVKDRRKSKPRALLTVEPVGEDKEKLVQDLPKPGRASLEWISDDAESELEADFSASTGSSGTDSVCPGFAKLQEWNSELDKSSTKLSSLMAKLEEIKLELTGR